MTNKEKDELIHSLMSSAEYISGWGVEPAVVYGWVCPKCGRVMSPNMPFCPCGGEGAKVNTSTETAEEKE